MTDLNDEVLHQGPSRDIVDGLDTSCPVPVKRSLMALIAMALGLASLLVSIVLPMAGMLRGRHTPPYFKVFLCFGFILPLFAIVLGIVSLSRISRSGGSLSGRNFAVIGIIVPVIIFVLLTFMPALTGFRSKAFRMTCGTNLSRMGKAMLIYANDYEDELPKAGGRNNTWASAIPNWFALNRRDAYGISGANGDGTASISSSLYLLIKYCSTMWLRLM